MVSLQKIIFHPLMAVLFTVLTILALLSLRTTSKRSQMTAQNVTELSRHLDETNRDINKLEQQLATTDQPERQDQLIRDLLLMQKPGEYVVQVAPTSLSLQASPTPSPLSPWQSWQHLLTD